MNINDLSRKGLVQLIGDFDEASEKMGGLTVSNYLNNQDNPKYERIKVVEFVDENIDFFEVIREYEALEQQRESSDALFHKASTLMSRMEAAVDVLDLTGVSKISYTRENDKNKIVFYNSNGDEVVQGESF